MGDTIELTNLTGAMKNPHLNAIVAAIMNDDQAALNQHTAMYKVEKLSARPPTEIQVAEATQHQNQTVVDARQPTGPSSSRSA